MDLADAALALCAALGWLFCGLYAVRSPWRRTITGRILLGAMGALSGTLTAWTVSSATDHAWVPLRLVWAGLLAGALAALIVELLHQQSVEDL